SLCREGAGAVLSFWPKPSGLIRYLCPALERQFQSSLNLTRRTIISRRETCCGDSAKRGALGIQIGVPEVGMIEHVESFGAELQVHSLRKLRIFDQGQIGVDESRTGKRSAAEIAEVIGGR